jgi:hypothetical protein
MVVKAKEKLWVLERESGSLLYPQFLCQSCLSEHLEKPERAYQVPCMKYSSWYNFTEGKMEDSFCPLCCRSKNLVNLMRVDWPPLILLHKEIYTLAKSLTLMTDDRNLRAGKPADWAMEDIANCRTLPLESI